MIVKIAGSVLKATLVSSGSTFSPISSSLLDGEEALVSSLAATSSGNGHYYANHQLPSTPGIYVNAWAGVANTLTYRARQYVRTVLGESD